MTTSFNVTRRELVLGIQDTETGWYIPSYNNSTIKMMIFPKGTDISNIEAGQITRYTNTGLTSAVIAEGDQIINAFNDKYYVTTAEPYMAGESFDHYTCQLETLPLENLVSYPYSAYPYSVAVSADNGLHRTKVWLESYLNNTYLPHYIVAAAYPTLYPITRVFKDKNIDLIFSISKPESTPMFQGDKTLYGFEETIPINLSAVDKDVSGQSLIEQAESEIRRMCDEHTFGSLRIMKVSNDKTVRKSGFTLHNSEFSLTYRRTKAA
jgi:hypothetical protein